SLQALNKELEAFSYSVSHDLRAPLRAINGFSRILIEDYADKLDESGKDLLQRIQESCRSMGQLIEDLLKLAYLSRREMYYERVNLSALALSIIGELQKSHPDRKVRCQVADGLVTRGDSRLLRVALENLLSNAWKFTARQEQAGIEFGMTHHAE